MYRSSHLINNTNAIFFYISGEYLLHPIQFIKGDHSKDIRFNFVTIDALNVFFSNTRLTNYSHGSLFEKIIITFRELYAIWQAINCFIAEIMAQILILFRITFRLYITLDVIKESLSTGQKREECINKICNSCCKFY